MGLKICLFPVLLAAFLIIVYLAVPYIKKAVDGAIDFLLEVLGVDTHPDVKF